MMTSCENSSSWERYVVDKSFNSSHKNVWSCFLRCEAPMWPLTSKTKDYLCSCFFVRRGLLSQSASFEYLEEWELNIAQSHDPSVPVGENLRLCSCGHYCALICWLEALKDYRCIQVELLFAYLATVKMLEAGVKSNEASGNLSLKTY